MTNKEKVKVLQIEPSRSMASKILDIMAKDDYSRIIDNNVNRKQATLKMISVWLDDSGSRDKGYYSNLYDYIQKSPYHWFNQSDLKPVSASDVIYMLEH